MSGLFLLLLISVANAHDWGFGRCPRVDPFQNLAVEKFLGLWFVIEQFDTSSTCLTLNYSRLSPTELVVTKDRQLYLLDRVGVEHKNAYSGTLDLPDEEVPAKMRVKWPLNIAGKADYIVFDTDYTGYAGIYECQQLSTLFHRQSAAILSRSATLDSTYVDRVRRRLLSFNIDGHDFDKIDHRNCTKPANADLNIKIDSNTFTNLFSSAAAGIEGAAKKVAVGVKDVADAVAEGTRHGVETYRSNSTKTPAEELPTTKPTAKAKASESPAAEKEDIINLTEWVLGNPEVEFL